MKERGLGEPTISCGTEQISFWVKTRNCFQGKVYVKGEYGRNECQRNFANCGRRTTDPFIIQSTPATTERPGECPPCPVCQRDDPSRLFRYRRQLPTNLEGIPEMAHLTVNMGTCNIRRERTVTTYHSGFVNAVLYCS